MTRLFATFILCSFAIAACAQDTTLYNDTFKLYSKGKLINGKREGHWVSYDIADNLTEDGYYKNGVKSGHWKYFLNRHLTSEGNYKSGKRCGVWREYYLDGHEIMIGKYEDDLKQGSWRTYQNDSLILYELTRREIKKKCRLKNTVEYKDGKLVKKKVRVSTTT